MRKIESSRITSTRNKNVKILCVEDDPNLAKLLETLLVQHHYQVDLARDGLIGWNFAETFTYDLILLDIGLPRLDGLQFCQQLRVNSSSPSSRNSDTPVLLMTALDTVTNKVMGLDAGADDYIVKPFDLQEFLARIRALLRRHPGTRSPQLTWGELCMNLNSCQVTYQDQPLLLTAKEYELLELFLRNPHQIFSVSRLLDCLWNYDDFPSEGTVRAHIKGLRKKLKEQGSEDIIETLYKLGYRLRLEKQNQTPNKAQKSPKKPEVLKEFSQQLDPSFLTSEMLPELWPVWQESQPLYCERLSIVQQAIAALYEGRLTPEQQHHAEREIHTLIGSLGCFGLMSASDLSRQIQQILKSGEPLGLAEADQLQTLTTKLRNAIEQTNQQIHPKSDPQPQPQSKTPIRSTLLLVDDDFPLAQIIAIEAVNWGYESHIATDLRQAQQLLTQYQFDGMILDLNFPNSTETGLDFLATVRDQYPNISVVMLTAEPAWMKRIEAARLGSPCFLQKPLTPNQIMQAVSQVLEQKNSLSTRILVVDDNLILLEALESVLEDAGYQVILLNQAEKFWEILEQTAPDLLILDLELSNICALNLTDPIPSPSVTGWDLCEIIRRDPRWNRLPILVLSGYTDPETIQRSFTAGADDVLSKPIGPQELLTRIEIRLQQRQRWKMTELDELTGVSLRRKALQDLTSLLHLAQRQQQPFSLVMLDLDHFKRINDQYGHDIGDQVLSYLGKLLQQSLRQEDVVGRWGGEEFVIGIYGIMKSTGIHRLQEIFEVFSQHQFWAKNGIPFQVTFSGGIAQFPDDGKDIQTLYQAADTALYQAKAQGRSRIVIS